MSVCLWTKRLWIRIALLNLNWVLFFCFFFSFKKIIWFPSGIKCLNMLNWNCLKMFHWICHSFLVCIHGSLAQDPDKIKGSCNNCWEKQLCLQIRENLEKWHWHEKSQRSYLHFWEIREKRKIKWGCES